MVDYSKLSDFEINKRVALAYGKNIKFISVDVDDNDVGIIVGQKHTRQRLPFDPCNNPADAWPIIVGSKINIRFGAEGMVSEAQYIQYGYESVEYYHANPLRAAMIVFLMMQDANNG